MQRKGHKSIKNKSVSKHHYIYTLKTLRKDMYQAQEKMHPHYLHKLQQIINNTNTEDTIYYSQSIYKTKGAWLFNTSSHYPEILLSIYLL